MKTSTLVEEAMKEFDDKFLWEVRPVGVKKGDPEQREYVLGMPFMDWADDTTLGKVREEFKSQLQHIEKEAYERGKHTAIEDLDFYDLTFIAITLMNLRYPKDVWIGKDGDTGSTFVAALRDHIKSLTNQQ